MLTSFLGENLRKNYFEQTQTSSLVSRLLETEQATSTTSLLVEASMRLKWFFVVICSSFFLLLTNGEKISSKIAYAINAVIDKHFASQEATRPGNVDIVLFGDVFYEVGALLEMKSKTTVITIYKYDKLQIEDGFYEFRESSIVFFESVKWFNMFSAKVKWTFNQEKRHHHLVCASGLTAQEIIGTFTDGFSIDHVSFLVEETEKSIELHTTWMFTKVACRELQVARINRFDFDTMEWENLNFYPKKYENFYGCALTMFDTTVDPMIKIFEDKLKAKIITNDIDKEGFPKCDFTGSFKLLGVGFGIASYPLHDGFFSFLIGPGEPYTDLERMFKMFDFETWIAITATLIIGFSGHLRSEFCVGKSQKVHRWS